MKKNQGQPRKKKLGRHIGANHSHSEYAFPYLVKENHKNGEQEERGTKRTGKFFSNVRLKQTPAELR